MSGSVRGFLTSSQNAKVMLRSMQDVYTPQWPVSKGRQKTKWAKDGGQRKQNSRL